MAKSALVKFQYILISFGTTKQTRTLALIPASRYYNRSIGNILPISYRRYSAGRRNSVRVDGGKKGL